MKKKILKKTLFIVPLLLIVGVLGYAVLNVKAAGITITTNTETLSGASDYKKVTNTGEFKVIIDKKINASDTLKAYKVLDAYYSSTANFVRYDFTSDFKTFLSGNNTYKDLTVEQYIDLDKGTATSQGIPEDDSTNRYSSGTYISGGYLETNDFARLMSAYAAYIRTHSSVSGTTLSATPYSSPIGLFSVSNLAVGTYMVLPESSSYVYGVMVDSVQLKKANGEWSIKSGQIYAKTEDSGISIAYTYNGTTSNLISADIGKPIPVTITANLPTYPADATIENKTSTIFLPSDFSSGSIQFNSSSPSFNIICGTISSGAGNALAEVVCDSTRMPTSIKLNTQLTVSTSSAIITYNKILSTDATIGETGNQTTVTMNYPDAYDSSKILTSEATGTIKTYALQITGNAGAVFNVLKGSSTGKSMGIVTIGNNGTGKLVGLAAGTYYIKQTKAPAGYSLLTITPTATVGSGTQVSGKPGYYNVTAINNTPSLLPFTGATGTILFITIGVILIAGAVACFIIYRKKRQNPTT